jgi:type IV pilus assembly protein PilC
MAVFNYVAKKSTGEVVTAPIKAANVGAVKEFLEGKGLIVVSVTEEVTRSNPILDAIPFLKPGVSGKQLLIFTKYFSILVKAGIPVLKAMSILADQTENPYFKGQLEAITTGVEGGMSLSQSFDQFPETFPENYRSLIKIGEESGSLHEILVRLHDNLQKASALKSKVIGAMVYPIAISLVAVGVVVFLLTMIIPKFVKIFENHGAELPVLTAYVVGASNLLLHRWYLIILGLFAISFTFQSIYKTDKGKLMIHAFLLKPPILGTLMLKYGVASFAQNLDMLSRGGASMANSLKMAIKSVDNLSIRTQLQAVPKDVEAGTTIARAMEKVELMPSLVLQMIAVGEETGALNEMLETINNFYEDEIDASVGIMLSLIEPVFILFLGGVVGTIVIAMYMPIFKMSQAVSAH